MDGAKLIAARLRKGWSQEKTAEMLQVSLATVQRWEHGESTPRGYNQQQISDVLGLTPEELLGIEVITPTTLPPLSPRLASIKRLQVFVKQDLTVCLWSLTSQSYRTHEVHSVMVRILKDYESMNPKNYQITRRKALVRLVSLPLATLGVPLFVQEESPPPAAIKEILAECAVSIVACGELRNSTEHNDLIVAFDGVSMYLPVLQRIVKDSSHYRQEAANLVTQCLLLKSKIGRHLEGPPAAMRYAQQALSYSKEANDIPLQLRVLECLYLAYAYSKRNRQALQTIEQALPLLRQKSVPIPSRVRALINGGLAGSMARNGQDGTAYLDQAEKFVADPDTQHLAYVNYDNNRLLLDAGFMYYHQGMNVKAIEALSQLVDPEALALKTPWSGVGRIEAINLMTMASLKTKEKDMEQILHFWTEGIQAARVLQSEQRFNEAVNAYEIMEVLWPDEKRIKDVHDLIVHW